VKTADYLGSPFVWIDSHAPLLEIVEGALLTQQLDMCDQMARVRHFGEKTNRVVSSPIAARSDSPPILARKRSRWKPVLR